MGGGQCKHDLSRVDLVCVGSDHGFNSYVVFGFQHRNHCNISFFWCVRVGVSFGYVFTRNTYIYCCKSDIQQGYIIMNTKLMLLFIIVANVLAVFFYTYMCSDTSTNCPVMYGESPVEKFFNMENYKLNAAPTATTALESSYKEAITPPSTNPVVATLNAVLNFIDSIKQVLSFLALLTPIPIISFLWGLSIDLLIRTFLMVVLSVMWVAGVAEFVRGAKL